MIILILGGVRSGKSSYAIELAKDFNKKTVFIATCIFFDNEMKERIKLHKRKRPKDWKLIEEGKNICSILASLKNYETIFNHFIFSLSSNLLRSSFDLKMA